MRFVELSNIGDQYEVAEHAIYEQLLAEAKASHQEHHLSRLEHGFREYFRKGGEEELHLPGLRRRSWWDTSEIAEARLLEASYGAIREELEQLLAQRAGFQHYDEGPFGFNPENTAKGWNVFYLRSDCQDLAAIQARCPQTSACLKALPNLGAAAFFSALSAGSHLEAHTGSMGVVLTVHMGLIVPEGCFLRVGEETRAWKEGRCIAFQDTFEHEARNESQHTRFNLMLDIWHPDLTPFERAFLERWTWNCGEWARQNDDTGPHKCGELEGVKWWT